MEKIKSKQFENILFANHTDLPLFFRKSKIKNNSKLLKTLKNIVVYENLEQIKSTKRRREG